MSEELQHPLDLYGIAAYEASIIIVGEDLEGGPLPWASLPPKHREAWRASADAVLMMRDLQRPPPGTAGEGQQAATQDRTPGQAAFGTYYGRQAGAALLLDESWAMQSAESRADWEAAAAAAISTARPPGWVTELQASRASQSAENATLSRKLAEANTAIVAITGRRQLAAPVVVTWDPRECTTTYIDEIAEAVKEQSGGRVIITMTDIADSDCHAVIGPREYTDDEALELLDAEAGEDPTNRDVDPGACDAVDRDDFGDSE